MFFLLNRKIDHCIVIRFHCQTILAMYRITTKTLETHNTVGLVFFLLFSQALFFKSFLYLNLYRVYIMFLVLYKIYHFLLFLFYEYVYLYTSHEQEKLVTITIVLISSIPALTPCCGFIHIMSLQAA